MPGPDGYALAATIRREESARGVAPGAQVPILSLTANAFPEDLARAEAVGVDACLTKPLLLDVLKAGPARWMPVAGPDERVGTLGLGESRSAQ